MADITKCPGSNCPNKDNCYRYTAKDDLLQSYFVDPPAQFDEEGKFVFCGYFLNLRKWNG